MVCGKENVLTFNTELATLLHNMKKAVAFCSMTILTVDNVGLGKT
jgi:hypothetical protein